MTSSLVAMPADDETDGPRRAMSGYTIDVDTGGTFTDCYVTGAGFAVVAKADTTPHDPTQGVLNSIAIAAQRLGLSPAALLRSTDIVRFATTVGTNTLINRDGPNVGLLYCAGLVALIRSLPARLPLSPALCVAIEREAELVAVLSAVRQLLDRGARLFVVALERGPDLAQREAAVRAVILGNYPRHYLGAVPVLMSHQISPIDDERVRIQTAVLDAYLHPVMSRFLYRVEDELRAAGYRRPLLVANSNGGVSRVAKTTALRTWGSGPAGGVAATAHIARHLVLPRALAIDVGGTSTDLCLVSDGRWEYDVQPVILDAEVALPVLSLSSLPLGGGTIARVVAGALHLGPDSAGAQPGPAAFALGGEDATVTDAACVAGFFDPAHFLGGRKRLDLEAAHEVVGRELAAPLGVPVEVAAWRVLDAAAAFVAAQVRDYLAPRGVAAEHITLLATGGAGGLIAAAVARLLGVKAAYALPVAAAFSAFGLSRLGLLHTYELRAGDDLPQQLAAAQRRAEVDMRGEGVAAGDIRYSLEAEITRGERVCVEPLPLEALVSGARPPAEARVLRLQARAPARTGILPRAGDAPAVARAARAVRWPQQAGPTPLYDWERLAAGGEIVGPAILENQETTIVIPPDARVSIGALGEARITVSAGAKR